MPSGFIPAARNDKATFKGSMEMYEKTKKLERRLEPVGWKVFLTLHNDKEPVVGTDNATVFSSRLFSRLCVVVAARPLIPTLLRNTGTRLTRYFFFS